MEGFNLLRQGSKTATGPALARSVGFVLEKAKDLTPFATMGQIDTELQVQTEPRLYKSGAKAGLQKLGKGRYKEPLTNITGMEDDSLAAKIILARLSRYSNYNVLTDMRYALDRKTFSPGAGESGFWTVVKAAAAKMIRTRHSSTHFFQQSWNAVIEKLVPYVPEAYKGHFASVAGGMTPEFSEIGRIEYSGQGSAIQHLLIENRLGMAEKYPTINAIRNLGANKQMAPALQKAIDLEFLSQINTAMKRGLLDEAAKIRMLGFKTS